MSWQSRGSSHSAAPENEEEIDVKQLSKHLSFANVISCIALFVALSGATYAATTTLGKKSVKTKNLANGAVTKLKIRGGAVTNLKLHNGAVTGAKIANATIGSSQLANGAVRSEQLGGGVVTTGKLKNGAVTGEKIAAGAVGGNQLGANAVTTGKLGKEAVTGEKLAASLLGSLVRNVVYVSKASQTNTTEEAKTVSAECPGNDQVTGGGARLGGLEPTPTKVAIIASAPLSIHAGRMTGWTASARAIAAEANPWSVEAFAICAEF
jgi:hypothetical protein